MSELVSIVLNRALTQDIKGRNLRPGYQPVCPMARLERSLAVI